MKFFFDNRREATTQTGRPKRRDGGIDNETHEENRRS